MENPSVFYELFKNVESDNNANRSSMNNNIDSSAVSGVSNVVGAFKQAF